MASAYLDPVSPRRRATAIGLTIAIHVLLGLALINLAPWIPVAPSQSGALSTFTVAPAQENAPRQRQRIERQRKAADRPPEPPRTPPVEPPPPLPSGIIWMNRESYAATDVRRLPNKARAENAQSAVGAPSAGAVGDTSDAIGTGPDGQPLYAARWEREPTNAELRTYLPPAETGSWGIIACKTAPRNTVEDCRTLDENPRGSGLATGIRRAAWQFRVIPPKRGGEPMIGAWVRIRIEFTERGAAVRR